MTQLGYDRYCSEIVAQTSLLTSALAGADLAVPVPTCPGWDVGRLLRHLGGAHRWAEETVRTRASEPPAEEFFGDLPDYTDKDLGFLGPWLNEGAGRLAATLRSAGPDARMWTPVPGGTAAVYARRFTHEAAIHRADATLAVGAPYVIDAEVAIDAIDEWMEIVSLPMNLDEHPRLKELLEPGRTLHLHAIDAEPEAGAEWLVDLTGDSISWRRSHEKAAVAVRGPLTELLLLIYRRRSADSADFEVIGEMALLNFWLDRVSFG